MTDDLAALAGRLTEAQRQCVLTNRADGGPQYGWRRSGSICGASFGAKARSA